MNYDVKDPGLFVSGGLRVDYAWQQMPVLRLLEERFAKEKPLAGVRLGACLHVTTETANLMRVLKAGGADVSLCASNPLSTQDDTAAWIAMDRAAPMPTEKRVTNDNAPDPLEELRRIVDSAQWGEGDRA